LPVLISGRCRATVTDETPYRGARVVATHKRDSSRSQCQPWRKLLSWDHALSPEANYAWVVRESYELPSDATARQIVTAAKDALGLTGQRCRRFDYGEGFELRPIGSCSVAFILPRY
jgi:hypothetical protein